MLLALDGKFSAMSFDVGRIDGKNHTDAEVFVEADGSLVSNFTVREDEGLKKLSNENIIKIQNADVVKLYQRTNDAGAAYGYVNIRFYY